MKIHILAFWVMAPCSLVSEYPPRTRFHGIITQKIEYGYSSTCNTIKRFGIASNCREHESNSARYRAD
jgi:hypothetical protein